MKVSVFIRHGPVLSDPGLCLGWLDPALRDPAQTAEVMRAWGRSLSPCPIFASDLQRSREGARLLAEAWGADVQVDTRLREISFGSWEGLRWEEIERRDHERYQKYMKDWRSTPTPGGESYDMLQSRLTEFARIMPEPCVIVGHSGALRVLAGLLCNLDPGQALGRRLDYHRGIAVDAGKGELLGWNFQADEPPQARAASHEDREET